MEIIEYNEKYSENMKDLLIELQEFIVSIDDWKLNILTPEYREKYYKKTINEAFFKDGKIYLAVENGEVLGLIAGFIEKYDEFDRIDYACPKTGKISELIVSKNARKKGVGKGLLEKMELFFKQENCEYVHIDVFEPNANALSFYEKNNYVTRVRNLSKKL